MCVKDDGFHLAAYRILDFTYLDQRPGHFELMEKLKYRILKRKQTENEYQLWLSVKKELLG